jgi:hypothetical protein
MSKRKADEISETPPRTLPNSPQALQATNPQNSPTTAALNQRLIELANQETNLTALRNQNNDTGITESLNNLRQLAQQIQALGNGEGIQADLATIRGILETEQAQMRERIQTIRQDRHALQQYISDFINRSFQGISTATANLLVSLIVISILTSDNTATNATIQSIFGNSTIGNIFTLLSTYVVRPFVDINLQNIDTAPQLLAAGLSSNATRQSRALLAILFTGVSAYGLKRTISASNAPQIAASIQQLFPILHDCIISGATTAASAAANCVSQMYDSVINYIRTNMIQPVQEPAAGAGSASVGSFSTSSSSQIGSVAASLLGSIDSIEPTMRAVFQELVNPTRQSSSDTQLSDLTQSQGTVGGRSRRSQIKRKTYKKRKGRRIRRKTNKKRARRTRR